ncbi:MAG: hypothetical protein V1738_02335 [Patescibacteria group bacterium]
MAADSKKTHQMFVRESGYHRTFGRKAGKEAERVLKLFENELPKDTRPRRAIEAILAWSEGNRRLGMAEVRKLSLNAHAAAREARSVSATAAARAAGHAIATWHVPTHALAVFSYSQKAICASKHFK